MSSQTNTSRERTREMPGWATALVLLLVLAGGGWGLWRYLSGDSNEMPVSAAIAITDANVVGPALPRGFRQRPPGAPNFGEFAARLAANMPDGIMPAGTNRFLVKSGPARLDIESSTKGDWRYRFSYALGNLVPPDQMQVLRAGRRVLFDNAAATKAGVSAQQLQELRTLPGGGMVVEAADRAQINVLFRQWLAATGRSAGAPAGVNSGVNSGANASLTTQPANTLAASPEAKDAEKQLVAALSAIATKQLEPTKKSYLARAEQVRNILGDGVLQKLKAAG